MPKTKTKTKTKSKPKSKALPAAPAKRAKKSPPPQKENKYFRVRRSGISGRGAFATTRIPKGRRVIEYVGEVISHEEAERRYPEDKHSKTHYTTLFTIDKKRILDAEFEGNDARFINHSCAPNCITVDYDGRIYIETKRTIEEGEELVYDYKFDRSANPKDDKWQERLYGCQCGAPKCRGTMMVPRRKKKLKSKP